MEQGKTAHTLLIEERANAKLTGVIAVNCFHEQEVVLETQHGEVALLGRNLHIEQLNLEEGQLDVSGEIEGVEYNIKKARKEKRGFFGRKGP